MSEGNIKFEYAVNLQPYDKVVKKEIAQSLLDSLKNIQTKMSAFITLANEVGINADDGFYLHAAMEAEKKARAAISKALGEE